MNLGSYLSIAFVIVGALATFWFTRGALAKEKTALEATVRSLLKDNISELERKINRIDHERQECVDRLDALEAKAKERKPRAR